MAETPQAAPGCGVGKDHGCSVDETAGRDGPHHFVTHRRPGSAGGHGALILGESEDLCGGTSKSRAIEESVLARNPEFQTEEWRFTAILTRPPHLRDGVARTLREENRRGDLEGRLASLLLSDAWS